MSFSRCLSPESSTDASPRRPLCLFPLIRRAPAPRAGSGPLQFSPCPQRTRATARPSQSLSGSRPPSKSAKARSGTARARPREHRISGQERLPRRQGQGHRLAREPVRGGAGAGRRSAPLSGHERYPDVLIGRPPGRRAQYGRGRRTSRGRDARQAVRALGVRPGERARRGDMPDAGGQGPGNHAIARAGMPEAEQVAQRQSPAAGPAGKTSHLGKPSCRPRLRQRPVRPGNLECPRCLH
jgi:hypothetical protein